MPFFETGSPCRASLERYALDDGLPAESRKVRGGIRAAYSRGVRGLRAMAGRFRCGGFAGGNDRNPLRGSDDLRNMPTVQ